MNRRLSGAVVLGVALVSLAAVTVTARAQNQAQRANLASTTWQAERAFQLNKILERAKTQLKNTYIKVEIGTMAPIDVQASEQAVAQMEAMIKADAVRNPSGTAPQAVSATRLQLAQALNELDFTEVKFDNGMVSTKAMNDAYFGVLSILIPK